MKPRISTWGNANQFVVHRGEDRMLFDHRWFSDEAACWAAVRGWLSDQRAMFDLEKQLHLVQVGIFAMYRPHWTGTEAVVG